MSWLTFIHPHTDVYIGAKSKTALYVNRADGLIIDIETSGRAQREIPCLPCQQRRKWYGAITKLGRYVHKGSGNSNGNPRKPPECLPRDFNPGEGWEWRGPGEEGSTMGAWFNPATRESYHPCFDHGPPDGPHWDYNTRIREKIKIPVCEE